MAIVVENATLGGETFDSSSSTTIATTTTHAVAAGSFIVLCVGWFQTATLNSVSGGGLSWSIDKQGFNFSNNMAVVSAQAPSGMASGTTLTGTLSAACIGRVLGGASFTGVATSSPVDGTPPAVAWTELVAAWATNSLTISAGSLIVTMCYNESSNAGNTITSPAVEIYDLTAAGGAEVVGAYRIESSAGSYTIAGNWNSAAAKWANVAVAYKAAVAATTYTLAPHNVTPLAWRT